VLALGDRRWPARLDSFRAAQTAKPCPADRSCPRVGDEELGMSAARPGATIGIIGGGQLGRMLAMAAARLGYRTIVSRTAGRLPGRAGRQPADRRRL
jgi:phosphoglycerate dehydrogenase-like enzyme